MKISRLIPFLSGLNIRNKHGTVVPFNINQGQRIILQKFQELEDQGKPLWAIVLKARRLGVSTLTEGMMLAHCIEQPNAHALLVAHKFKSASALFDTARRMRDSLPVDLPPGTQQLIEIPHPGQKSTLRVATAGSTAGGRGLSLSALHLSEAAFFPMSAGSFSALLPTVPHSKDTILVIESTANGRVNEGEAFYEFWNASVDGRTDFLPIFLPWTTDPECVKPEEFAADAPQDAEEKDLLKMGLSKAQLAWRRWAIENECQGMRELFDQEFPITPEVAFVSTGFPAFTREDIRNARESVMKPILTGLITRERGDVVFHPANRGYRFWEKPQPGHSYYIGADCARGNEDGDFAAIVVINGSTGDIACRMAEKIGADQMADQLDMIGRYFNNAMINVELTGNTGTWVQSLLRDKFMYPLLYTWRGARDDRVRGRQHGGGSIGWETTYRSRQLLFSAFRDGLITGRIGISDEVLLSQMEGATLEEGWRWEVKRGHDDILFATLIAWIAVCQYPPGKHFGHRMLRSGVVEYETLNSSGGEPRIIDDVSLSLRRHWKEVLGRKSQRIPAGLR